MAAFEKSRLFRPRHLGPSRAPTARLAPLLLAVAAGLLLIDRIEPAMVAPVRAVLSAVVTPVAALGSAILAPLGQASSEVGRFIAGPATGVTNEAARMASLEMKLRTLERENRDLKALTRFARMQRPGPSAMIAARVIMSSGSPLAQTFTIDAGHTHGVKVGLPVVSGEGLIGRVLTTTGATATVLLLSDRLSRVPVAIGQAGTRGVLVGSGSGAPRLDLLASGAVIAPGDLVTTSGVGGVFPRGLAVGVVAVDGAGWRVELTAGRDDPLAVGVLAGEGADPSESGALRDSPAPGSANGASPRDQTPRPTAPSAALLGSR